jgi:hypothetical protein
VLDKEGTVGVINSGSGMAQTPAAGAGSITAAAKRIIKLSESSDIKAAAKDASGAGISGQTVTAVITNNPSTSTRGILNPASLPTDAAGNAVITFTGSVRGTADIDLICGGKTASVRIWVCHKMLDYVMVILRIPF